MLSSIISGAVSCVLFLTGAALLVQDQAPIINANNNAVTLPWTVVIAIAGSLFTLGGVVVRVYIHSNYHRDHFEHNNDEKKHPDARIQEERDKALRESQIRLNDAVAAHMLNDAEADRRFDAKLDKIVEDHKDQNEKFHAVMLEQNRVFIKAVSEIAGGVRR